MKKEVHSEECDGSVYTVPVSKREIYIYIYIYIYIFTSMAAAVCEQGIPCCLCSVVLCECVKVI